MPWTCPGAVADSQRGPKHASRPSGRRSGLQHFTGKTAWESNILERIKWSLIHMVLNKSSLLARSTNSLCRWFESMESNCATTCAFCFIAGSVWLVREKSFTNATLKYFRVTLAVNVLFAQLATSRGFARRCLEAHQTLCQPSSRACTTHDSMSWRVDSFQLSASAKKGRLREI